MLRKVQFGCGHHHIQGWENHDTDINIERPLPFTNTSIHYIFAEHVLEHIPHQEGYRFLEECYRILKPGGVIRIVVPSVEALSERFTPAYGDFIRRNGWGDGSLKSALAAIVFLHGHRAVWTAGSLLAILSSFGFVCEVSKADHSRHVLLDGIDGHGSIVGHEINNMEAVVIEGTKAIAEDSEENLLAISEK